MDKSIASQVKRLAAEKSKKITPDELFESPEFREYVNSSVKALTRRYHGKAVKVNIYRGELDGNTACTDGNVIHLNYHHSRNYMFTSLWNNFLSLMGGIYHEVSHILYMDFEIASRARNEIRNGHFFGELPDPESDDDEAAIEALENAVADPMYRDIIEFVYANILNIIQDGHDEDKMIAESTEAVANGILMRREAKKTEFPAVEDMCSDTSISKLQVMFSLMLEMALFEDVFCEDMATAIKKFEPLQKLYDVLPDLQTAKYTDSASERCSVINSLMVILWPYIAEEIENQKQQQEQQSQQGSDSQNQQQNQQGEQNQQEQSGQSGEQQQNGQLSNSMQQALQNVMQQLMQAASMGQTAVPQNCKTSAEAKKAAKEAEKTTSESDSAGQSSQSQNQYSQQSSSDAGQEALQTLLNQISTSAAESAVQGEIAAQANAMIKTVDQNSTHKGRKCNFETVTEIESEDINRYNTMMKDLSDYSKRLQKLMKEALRDLQDGSISHHRYYGNRFEANAAYRPDQRCFAKTKAPQDWPDMAVSVLVDLSGSMCGERLESAMKATMLLYDFATNLNIPVEISGHHTSHNGISYYQFTDFRKVRDNEKYRLAKMRAGHCNRDGMAIEIALARLAQRQEDIRLFVIISDGQPNDDGYGGQAAYNDIKSIVGKYRKQRIETLACAIGSDKPQIKEIYGEGSFVGIDDLATFPKTLVNIIRKRIVY